MKEEVVIIGAGRSGRGMLGEMYYTDGSYHITFADRDASLVSGLRKQGYYTVHMSNVKMGTSRDTRVEGFDILDTQAEMCIRDRIHPLPFCNIHKYLNNSK